MNTQFFVEAFGYLGSLLVVVSMLMSSVIRLRIINMIGSVIFAIYALIIKSYPTALMNFFLVGINIYHLMRLRNTEKHYDLIEDSADGGYFNYLLRFYREDIANFFPDFSAKNLNAGNNRVFVVCCDQEAAGVLAGTQDKEKLEVLLDYSTPVYRDCSVGAYLYGRLPEYGIRDLTYRGNNAEHLAYLTKMGFEKTEDGTFHKAL